MRIRTVAGLAIATAATAGAVALGTAAFANDPGTEPVYRIDQGTSDPWTPADGTAARDDCPLKNGEQGQGEAPGQTAPETAPETAPADTL